MDETLQEMAFKKLAESLGLEHPENEDVVTIMLLASTRINRLNEEIKEYEYNDGNERCWMKIYDLAEKLLILGKMFGNIDVRIVGLDNWVTNINKENIKIIANPTSEDKMYGIITIDIWQTKENKLFKYW